MTPLAAAVVLLATGIVAAAVQASAAVPRPASGHATSAYASLGAPVTPPAARRGGGFRSRPLSPNRPLSRNRPVVRRNRNSGRALRSFSRTLLRALGIAFLVNLLFGIGPGGSPLGLLLLFGIIALVVVSRRRRRQLSYR